MSLNSLGGIISADRPVQIADAGHMVRLVSNQSGPLITRYTPVYFGVVCLISELRQAHLRRLHDNLHAMGIVVDESSATVGDA